MKIRHATDRSNLESIRQHGLLPTKSQGKLMVCWLHTASKSAWAVLHTMKRHQTTMRDVVVLEWEIPRAWLVRSSVNGLWKCARVIPPERMRQVIEGQQFAESPIEAK